jgi:membrane-associated phospholipid phosphatase
VLASVAALAALIVAARWSAEHARGVWRRLFALGARFAASSTARRMRERWPRLWSAIRAVTAMEYLALHLAIAFTAVLATFGFLAIAGAVFWGDEMARFDAMLATSIHASAEPSTVAFFRAITVLGSEGVVVAGVVLTIVLLVRRRRLLAVGWAISLLGGALLNAVLKAIFTRARPRFDDPFAVSPGFSFPSGHAMSTWIATGMIVYLTMRVVHRPRLRFAALCGALAFSVAMGFSRMVLGVHYLTDVVGGFAAGTVWLGACISALEIASQRGSSRPPAPEEASQRSRRRPASV